MRVTAEDVRKTRMEKKGGIDSTTLRKGNTILLIQ